MSVIVNMSPPNDDLAPVFVTVTMHYTILLSPPWLINAAAITNMVLIFISELVKVLQLLHFTAFHIVVLCNFCMLTGSHQVHTKPSSYQEA